MKESLALLITSTMPTGNPWRWYAVHVKTGNDKRPPDLPGSLSVVLMFMISMPTGCRGRGDV